MECTTIPGGEAMKTALENQGFACEPTPTGWRCIKTVIGPGGKKDITCFDVLN